MTGAGTEPANFGFARLPRQTILVRRNIRAPSCNQVDQLCFARSHRRSMLDKTFMALPLGSERERTIAVAMRRFSGNHRKSPQLTDWHKR